MLVKDLKKALKESLFDRNMNNEILRTPALKYIAAVRDKSRLKVIEELVMKYDDMNLHKMENQFIEAIYIDSEHDYNALFLTSKEEYNSLDSEKLNYGNDSIITAVIQKTILEKNLKSLVNFGFDTTVNIIYAFELCIANHHSISMEEMHYIKMSNTQKEIVRKYNLYRTDPNEIRSYDWNNYDHLNNFSLNYYAMVKVMSDVFKSSGNNRGFTVHDAGTSNSQLALMLSTLKKDDLMDLKVSEIIASDLVLECQDKTIRYINQYENPKPIKFIEQDFTDDSKELPEVDVTILNDVLEHFPTDELSFHVMERFWKRTRKLLIVHVPQEEEPGVEWGHYITFNREKLMKWADRLSGYIHLGDDYSFNKNLRYSDCGFLILKRID
jgi:hypothetical protein